jgi:hypothetical protein
MRSLVALAAAFLLSVAAAPTIAPEVPESPEAVLNRIYGEDGRCRFTYASAQPVAAANQLPIGTARVSSEALPPDVRAFIAEAAGSSHLSITEVPEGPGLTRVEHAVVALRLAAYDDEAQVFLVEDDTRDLLVSIFGFSHCDETERLPGYTGY